MSTVADTHSEVTPPARRRRVLIPSILSGLVLGLVAAIVAGVVVHSLISGARQADDTMVSAYLAWFIFFLVGIGAANYPIGWGLGHPETMLGTSTRRRRAGELWCADVIVLIAFCPRRRSCSGDRRSRLPRRRSRMARRP